MYMCCFILVGTSVMKNVDRPPSNPKRIIIQSTQECFSVDIPRAPAGTVRPETRRAADEDDDFMPSSKKRNLDDSPGKVLKKVVTKRRKAVPPPRQVRYLCLWQYILFMREIMLS
jgi:hypothetical protein